MTNSYEPKLIVCHSPRSGFFLVEPGLTDTGPEG